MLKNRLLLFSILLFFFFFYANAQDEKKEISLKKVLTEISALHNVRFSYIENEIEKSDKNLDSEIEIFQNALELSEIKARDIMVPRAEIIALEDSTNIEKVKENLSIV